MNKVFSILLALALAVSLGLVRAQPACAGDGGVRHPGTAATSAATPHGADVAVAAGSDLPVMPLSVYGLYITSTEGGSVDRPGEGMFSYHVGAVVRLVAIPHDDYRFVNWTGHVDTVEDVDAPFTTITIMDWYAITANFEPLEAPPEQYDLTVASTVGGSVAAPGEGTFTYEEGAVVDLVVEAEEGYRFVTWTGDIATIDDVGAAATTIVMHDHYSITAAFQEMPLYELRISSRVGGSVISPGEGTFNYEKGTVVHVAAVPDVDYRFMYWAGDVSTLACIYCPATTITVERDHTIIAVFEYVRPRYCFVATAAYGTPTAAQIEVLREFRDVVLLESRAGSRFVAWYYAAGPPMAEVIEGNEVLRTLARVLVVDPVVRLVEVTGTLWRSP